MAAIGDVAPLDDPPIGAAKKRQRNIIFGGHNEPNQKNEDRGSMHIEHSADGVPNLSSFAIFDGHNGSMAASICSQHFNRRVARRIGKMLSKEHAFTRPAFSRLDEVDAIVCESVRLTCEEVHANILQSHHSGATLNALFLLTDPEGSVRAYSANVGDSRCVVFLPENGLSSLSSEDVVLASEHDTVQTNRTPTGNRRGRALAYNMSEDHKLSLQRERVRLDSRLADYRPPPLPADIAAGYTKLILYSGESLDYDPNDESSPLAETGRSFLEAGYPGPGAMQTAHDFIQHISEGLNLQPKAVCHAVDKDIEMVSALDGTGFHSNNEDGGKEMKIVHQESFIARRTQGSIIGPEAIFSRYNLSINMTRSMGDKYGPRSVIAVPDISVLTIPVGQFARFILCSDGVWDVVTTDEMRVLALDYENVSETAVTLCYDAQARRINRRMRMDDITVIVVDVNPELFPRRSLADCCAVS